MKKSAFLTGLFSGLIAMFLFSQQVVAEEGIQGFEDFNGKTQVLDNYTAKGKWLVVMMWASDCYICNREAHEYVDFHMIHSDTDATVLGISLDGASRKKDAEKFIQKHSVDFPNLIAEPGTVADFYRELTGQSFRGTPTFLIFDPKGTLKASQAGAVPTQLIEDFIAENTKNNSAKK